MTLPEQSLGGEDKEAIKAKLILNGIRAAEVIRNLNRLEVEKEQLREQLFEAFGKLVGQQLTMGGYAEFRIDDENNEWDSYHRTMPVEPMEIIGVDRGDNENFVLARTVKSPDDSAYFFHEKVAFEVLSIVFEEEVVESGSEIHV